MNESDITAINGWLVRRGLEGASETDLLHAFCARCRDAGLDLSRAATIIDTLHPTFEGRAFRWRNDGVAEEHVVEYGPTTEGTAAAGWRRSVFHHLLTSGAEELRWRLGSNEPSGFSEVESMKADGHLDYLAFVHRFADGVIGGMDCVYSHWTTRRPGGFAEPELEALRRLVPVLALAVKCTSLARIAGTLVEVYLGRDAGHRVLSGRISRGVAERINAVLWFSDLRGYTTITDSAPPGEIIPLLNDYAEAVISAVGDAGGDVLKLIGDGTLAIFKADDPGEACRSALRAEADLRGRIAGLNARRAAEGRPVTTAYVGLHIGDVFYGNVGSESRLDFTVVGPAVNEASRVAQMCRSVDRDIVVSAAFADAVPAPERAALACVGRFALRGVHGAQKLFTLEDTSRGG